MSSHSSLASESWVAGLAAWCRRLWPVAAVLAWSLLAFVLWRRAW